MRIGLALCLTACATLQPSTQSTPPAHYAVRVARILDVQAGSYTGPSVILVRDGRIQQILPAERFHAGLADSTIDHGTHTAIPGLIDAHVHLTIGGPPQRAALAIARAGFTTVADLGARSTRVLRVRDSIDAGLMPGPRVVAAGLWIGVKGGTCEFGGIGIEGGLANYRARVRDNGAAGATIAKACVSGWPGDAFASPERYELPDTVLRAIVEEARSANQVVITHAISRGSVQASLGAGVHGLAHTALLDAATAAQMGRQGMFMITTLTSLTGGDTSAVALSLRRALSLARAAGVPLVFGTDGGVLPHGRNAEEFRTLVEAGLSPLDAIRAATVAAAQALGMADSVGVIRAGASADLVVVNGDPLMDVAVLQRPLLVMTRGRAVPRE